MFGRAAKRLGHTESAVSEQRSPPFSGDRRSRVRPSGGRKPVATTCSELVLADARDPARPGSAAHCRMPSSGSRPARGSHRHWHLPERLQRAPAPRSSCSGGALPSTSSLTSALSEEDMPSSACSAEKSILPTGPGPNDGPIESVKLLDSIPTRRCRGAAILPTVPWTPPNSLRRAARRFPGVAVPDGPRSRTPSPSLASTRGLLPDPPQQRCRAVDGPCSGTA